MFTKNFLDGQIGKRMRIVVYKDSDITIDLKIKEYNEKFTPIFEKYEFIDYRILPGSEIMEVIMKEVK